jgi:hypothetical protein
MPGAEASHWLLNMNSFPDISVYDQMWLGTHCIPAWPNYRWNGWCWW